MWPALAALGGAYLGYKGTKSQNIASAQQAERQMDFQERMSKTAHQRQVADMRAAGLNPILSATGGKGAATPSGAMAQQFNKYQVALQNASTAAQIRNIDANTINTLKSAEIKNLPASILGELGDTVRENSLMQEAIQGIKGAGQQGSALMQHLYDEGKKYRAKKKLTRDISGERSYVVKNNRGTFKEYDAPKLNIKNVERYPRKTKTRNVLWLRLNK